MYEASIHCNVRCFFKPHSVYIFTMATFFYYTTQQVLAAKLRPLSKGVMGLPSAAVRSDWGNKEK
jgi:hypothetical protein